MGVPSQISGPEPLGKLIGFDARGAASSFDADSKRTTSLPSGLTRSLVALRNLRMMHLLERIALRFNRAGIPLMALKGAALNLTLYERPDARPMADLDLLVQPEHLDRVTGLLEEIGCQRSQVLVREDFFPRFYYEIEYTSGSINPVTIDLHVRPLRPLRYSRFVPDDALWARAEPASVGQATVLVPCPEDMLIHLAAHAAIHGSARPMWLEDVQHWAESRAGRIDWDRFVASAGAWRLALPVTEAIRATEREIGRVCPPEVLRRLSRMPANWRDRLALWQAPRDNQHPIAHVLVNVTCTPGWRFTFGYLLAVLLPDRAHMDEWYRNRHRAWLPCAYLLRYLWPVAGRHQRFWNRFKHIDVRRSKIHGRGVVATRDIRAGALIAHYRVKPVDRGGPNVASQSEPPDGIERHAIIGRLWFLNHCCRPNAKLCDSKLMALTSIHHGEEVTIDYGPGTCDCKTPNDVPRHAITLEAPVEVDAAPEGTRPTTTRRDFFGDVAKKVIYIVPVMMTLSLSQAMAASIPSAVACLGSPCNDNDDCCELLGVQAECDSYTYAPCPDKCCCVKSDNPCNVDEDCCGGKECSGGTCG